MATRRRLFASPLPPLASLFLLPFFPFSRLFAPPPGFFFFHGTLKLFETSASAEGALTTKQRKPMASAAFQFFIYLASFFLVTNRTAPARATTATAEAATPASPVLGGSSGLESSGFGSVAASETLKTPICFTTS